MIGEVLPSLLREANTHPSGAFSLRGATGFRERMRAMDIFECMIRVDDVAQRESLCGINQNLDNWATSSPADLAATLAKVPRTWALFTVLTISPKAMGCLANHLSLYLWMEFGRAANRISSDQARALRENRDLEQYIGEVRPLGRPHLDLPIVMMVPMPSALRVVQNFRFRKGLLQDAGYQEAMRRYVRFFC